MRGRSRLVETERSILAAKVLVRIDALKEERTKSEKEQEYCGSS